MSRDDKCSRLRQMMGAKLWFVRTLTSKHRRFLPSLIAVAAVGVTIAGCSSTPESSVEATVNRVIDSGTLEVTVDGDIKTIALLAIETPAAESNAASTSCLEPEASTFVSNMLPPGTAVRLKFDNPEGSAQSDPAAVYLDEVSMNEALVTAGFGIARPEYSGTELVNTLQRAQGKAQADQVGFYSQDVDCTAPAQVMIATGVACMDVAGTASATLVSSTAASVTGTQTSSNYPTSTSDTTEPNIAIAAGASSAEIAQLAKSAASTLATVAALQASVAQKGDLLIWRALNSAQRAACVTAIDAAVSRSTSEHQALLAAVGVAEEREAADARAAEEERQAEAARVAEEQRVAAEAEAARVAEAQRIVAEAEAARVAEDQRVAAEAEAAAASAEQERLDDAAQAAEAARAAEQRRQQVANDYSGGNPAPTSISSNPGSPSGYNGPRCYAPGGQTWTPC